MRSLRSSLGYEPIELTFGTSGLRALVTAMTDLECYINTLGFLEFLIRGRLVAGEQIICVAGDLRDSTPRIMRAVITAITYAGFKPEYLGLIPTPALALRAINQRTPGIMVTGSHIPADRNGIKFYKPDGEVMKEDEPSIKSAVALVRARIYGEDTIDSQFDENGNLIVSTKLPDIIGAGREAYLARYETFFGKERLSGKQIVFYQHSAVGRDDLVTLLERLGAKVIPVGRSDVFIPIDSENITEKHQAYFAEMVLENPATFAMVSTDGDSDRPFMIDEKGEFHRGDVLGAIVAHWLGADAAAFPVSSSDAVTTWLDEMGVTWNYTKIGSPYVIAAMDREAKSGKQTVVGWEVNGGFLTGSDILKAGRTLSALPTRDAIFPIIVTLVAAIEAGVSISELFLRLPKRYTQAGLIDNFPTKVSKQIMETDVSTYFTAQNGFGEIVDVNRIDGLRLIFNNGDIAHLRPSGNAPQLRIYSVADSQKRADDIVRLAIADPHGLLRQIEQGLTH